MVYACFVWRVGVEVWRRDGDGGVGEVRVVDRLEYVVEGGHGCV
jgi:hypothetical protein